jgi:hypothetical protein
LQNNKVNLNSELSSYEIYKLKQSLKRISLTEVKIFTIQVSNWSYIPSQLVYLPALAIQKLSKVAFKKLA